MSDTQNDIPTTDQMAVDEQPLVDEQSEQDLMDEMESVDALLDEVVEEDEPVVEVTDVVEPEQPAEDVDNGRSWFVVHSYSGMENRVKQNLEHRIESMHISHKIFQVIVPTEEQIELKDGQRRVVEKRVFPGYILVQMVLDDESWYAVRNTPGVTGFVGVDNRPTPLSPKEVDRIMRRIEAEEPTVKVDFKPGERVRVVEGPFAEFQGLVSELDLDRGKARVLISMFGRETPVEVDILQLQKV